MSQSKYESSKNVKPSRPEVQLSYPIETIELLDPTVYLEAEGEHTWHLQKIDEINQKIVKLNQAISQYNTFESRPYRLHALKKIYQQRYYNVEPRLHRSQALQKVYQQRLSILNHHALNVVVSDLAVAISRETFAEQEEEVSAFTFIDQVQNKLFNQIVKEAKFLGITSLHRFELIDFSKHFVQIKKNPGSLVDCIVNLPPEKAYRFGEILQEQSETILEDLNELYEEEAGFNDYMQCISNIEDIERIGNGAVYLVTFKNNAPSLVLKGLEHEDDLAENDLLSHPTTKAFFMPTLCQRHCSGDGRDYRIITVHPFCKDRSAAEISDSIAENNSLLLSYAYEIYSQLGDFKIKSIKLNCTHVFIDPEDLIFDGQRLFLYPREPLKSQGGKCNGKSLPENYAGYLPPEYGIHSTIIDIAPMYAYMFGASLYQFLTGHCFDIEANNFNYPIFKTLEGRFLRYVVIEPLTKSDPSQRITLEEGLSELAKLKPGFGSKLQSEKRLIEHEDKPCEPVMHSLREMQDTADDLVVKYASYILEESLDAKSIIQNYSKRIAAANVHTIGEIIKDLRKRIEKETCQFSFSAVSLFAYIQTEEDGKPEPIDLSLS